MRIPPRVLRKTLSALTVRGVGLGLQIAMSVVIARLLGAEGMGLYTLYVTWLVLFAELISIGMPVYAMRTVAALGARGQGTSADAFVRRALALVMLGGAAAMLVPWFGARPMAEFVAGDVDLAPALRIAAVGALAFVGLRILAETLKAAGATQRGLFAEAATIPLVLLAALPALVLLDRLQDQSLLWLHAASVGCAFLMAAALWRGVSRRLGGEGGSAPPVISPALWPLWGGTLLNVAYVNLPILVLPHFASVEELGQFGVAFRLINLTTIILVTLAAILGPQFAAAYELKDPARLRLLLKRSQQFSLLLFLPPLIAFTLLAEPLLGIFGPEFRDARPLLWIMTAGQLVNAATGLVGYLLNMMHRERTELRILLGTGVAMSVGMILGGTIAGVLGVTLAYSAGLMLKNLLSFGFSLRSLRQLAAADSDQGP
ncbi:lipopolysaccharide biosynthesis protein [Marichromatium bheemlicum]|uniref:Oligosaccharide flippase family protein n=1 Tax=Marichromatium bheemlicum TaxID=365339 RepID=A0ABX1I970_9GAMM|nr:oligosaccharide flippase family protein [Marichromatium bheemlicum]NKN33584.1 oligosaccharide flippase family protein [Marichromatium bheemlicum]